MELKSFNEIIDRAKKLSVKKRGVVVAAADEHVLEAAYKAAVEGLFTPVLTGATTKIKGILDKLGFEHGIFNFVDVKPGESPAQKAIDVIRSGDGDFLIKGLIDTKDVLGPVVKKENGLHTGRIMTHVVIYQLPNYHKLMLHSDGGMVLYPDLLEKKEITINAVETLHKLGYSCPKVAVVCAVEKYNPKVQETVDARDLAEMNKKGLIPGCIIEGPISYDIAMSKEIANIKGYESENCGNFDAMIMPNLVAGNILGKALTVTAGAMMGGIIVGAKIPIVLTGRGTSAEEKFNSIALCILVSESGI